MSHMQPGRRRPIADWDDLATWLAESFGSLEIGDVFDLGSNTQWLDADESYVPCAQGVALDSAILLRLSTTLMGVPILRDLSTDGITLEVWHHGRTFADCTFGHIVSADHKLLASTCVVWFRDKHRAELASLGCELRSAVSLRGPRGIPPSERH